LRLTQLNLKYNYNGFMLLILEFVKINFDYLVFKLKLSEKEQYYFNFHKSTYYFFITIGSDVIWEISIKYISLEIKEKIVTIKIKDKIIILWPRKINSFRFFIK